MKKTTILSISLLLPMLFAAAQTLDYGRWSDHFPYNKTIAVVDAGLRIYSATSQSVFYYDKSDQSLNRMNKVTGELSDIGISDIAYYTGGHMLVVSYENTNLDLVTENGTINISDIKRKQIIGNKTINHIYLHDKYAYLACGFGIVVVDLDKKEIRDTYYIGPEGSQINVLQLVYNAGENAFFAATEKGVYRALANSNLAYYVNWAKETNLPEPDGTYNLVTEFNGKVYVNKSSAAWSQDKMYKRTDGEWTAFQPTNSDPKKSLHASAGKLLVSSTFMVHVYNAQGNEEKMYNRYDTAYMYPNDALYDPDGLLWIADYNSGLRSISPLGEVEQYLFNGPSSAEAFDMDITGNHLWAVAGARNASFNNMFHSAEFYHYANHKWKSVSSENEPLIADMRDLVCVAADPLNGNHAFIGSWGNGLIEADQTGLTSVYDADNSSLQAVINTTVVRIGGLVFDADNNLWVANSGAQNVLSLRKPDGTWKSFNLGVSGTGIDVANMVIDQSGQIWIKCRDNALMVYNYNHTPDNAADDQVRKITMAEGNGNLPGSIVSSMALDRDGQLWLGTDEGVAVIYSPSAVFNGGNYDAQRVMVEENGYLYALLETEGISAIAVNGNNEKWFGTDKSGLFLMSADGTKQVLHFTEANSPLISNSIQAINIAEDGEVFISTAMGMVSYKDYKIAPMQKLDSLKVFPNPVKPGYDGPIFISNTTGDSHVKITDQTGSLVWQTENEGGQILWDGKDLKGRKLDTGVYYIFITNRAETQQKVGKLLIVR